MQMVLLIKQLKWFSWNNMVNGENINCSFQHKPPAEFPSCISHSGGDPRCFISTYIYYVFLAATQFILDWETEMFQCTVYVTNKIHVPTILKVPCTILLCRNLYTPATFTHYLCMYFFFFLNHYMKQPYICIFLQGITNMAFSAFAYL